MANYQSGTGSDIGTLLRMIQEDKNTALTANPPASQPGSPIRALTQEPIVAPNSPTSATIVSTPPEGVTPQASAPGQVVSPVAPTPGVVAPVAPVAPSMPSSSMPNVSSPSGSGGSSPVAPAAPRVSAPSMPSLGTSISSSNFMGGGSPSSLNVRSSSPVSKPSASPAPSYNKTPTSSSIGNYSIGGTLAGAAPKIGTSLLDLGKFIGGKAAPILGGLSLSDFITNKLGLGGWFNPKKAS